VSEALKLMLDFVVGTQC